MAGYFCFTIRVMAATMPPPANLITPPLAWAWAKARRSGSFRRPVRASWFMRSTAAGPPTMRVHSGRMMASPPESSRTPPVGEVKRWTSRPGV